MSDVPRPFLRLPPAGTATAPASSFLSLALPQGCIKIDLTIVRDIDKDFDKQQLVSNIVEYAHQREAYIIAEGIETKEELLKVLELGVDYLQGYYLSYPQSNPQEVFDESIQTIKNYWKKR